VDKATGRERGNGLPASHSAVMTTWLPAILIGLVLGYGSIFLREMGLIIATLSTVVLSIVYVRQGRQRDIGLLLIAEGLAPTLITGSALWASLTRTDTQVGPDSWIFFGIGLLLIIAGVVVIRSAVRAVQSP
jgi:hypothetical protein